MNKLHHVAIKTDNIEWYVKFFKEVFCMNVKRETGRSGERKIWFHEGIQINETVQKNTERDAVDHIAISTDEIAKVIEKSVQGGCLQLKANWLQLPDGLKIELIEI